MSAPDITPDLTIITPADRQANFARWRRRSRLVRTLRIALPALIVAILAGLVAAVAYNALNAPPTTPRDTNAPITLVNPRFMGRDEKGRAFMITAQSATRDPRQFQRVLLDHPTLDMAAPDPLRATADRGVYSESDFKLYLSGRVRVVQPRGEFDTSGSVLNTKTGEVSGSDPVHGRGSLGEIHSNAYAVYGKGDQMVFTGGVHTRLNAKK